MKDLTAPIKGAIPLKDIFSIFRLPQAETKRAVRKNIGTIARMFFGSANSAARKIEKKHIDIAMKCYEEGEDAPDWLHNAFLWHRRKRIEEQK
ncbi:hypothetical protein COB52_01410 [Candidatus Kaiserbacteria bacterium]|nr:MAG: hypothetical protein COB52_01410 [Candidatus Kaiserbacteria bacterium]